MPQQHTVDYGALTSQSIHEAGAGSILADFEMLLGFVEGGLRSTGKHHLLPMDKLVEIDERMNRPLRPRLKRPQQRSFPHLNGLYLLLRSTQLGVAIGQGKTTGQLILNPAMHEQWLRLNATERYFNLLEAWLRRGHWESLGMRGGWSNFVALDARELWTSIPSSGRTFSKKGIQQEAIVFSQERACTLALLELFGLMAVERGEPDEGQNWCIKGVRHTPFGDALLPIVFEQLEAEILRHQHRGVDFGAWQGVLQPYFPQWVDNLRLPGAEFRDGVYYFKVSLGEPWRRIAIPAESDLEDLAQCIIRAFDFSGDHLYCFRYPARDGHLLDVGHPYLEEAEVTADEIAIGKLPLRERQTMKFQYDFGADWRFDVQLEKIDNAAARITKPTIVEWHGKAPKEYDDEW